MLVVFELSRAAICCAFSRVPSFGDQDSSQVKKPSSQARMTASTTATTTASMMALGFAEDSDFSRSVGSDCIVVSLPIGSLRAPSIDASPHHNLLLDPCQCFAC